MHCLHQNTTKEGKKVRESNTRNIASSSTESKNLANLMAFKICEVENSSISPLCLKFMNVGGFVCACVLVQRSCGGRRSVKVCCNKAILLARDRITSKLLVRNVEIGK